MIHPKGHGSGLRDFLACARVTRFWLAVATLVVAGVAQSAEQPSDTLQLELTSPLLGTPKSLDGSTSGEFLVTTASSGVLTLWSRYSPTAWQREIIRPPPRDEFATGGYYGAISPHGDYVALAVPPLSDGRGSYQPSTARIYMIDRASRQLITVFSAGIPTRITALRFSPDGTRLGAVLAQGCGVRVWTRRQWTNAARDQEPDFADDDGYGGADGVSGCCPGSDMSACEALPNGADVLFTGIADGSAPWMITLAKTGLRTYVLSNGRPQRAGSDLLTSDQMHLDQPTRMALSPDQTMLAVGDLHRPQVAVLIRDGLRFHWTTFPNWNTNLNPDSLLNADGKHEEGAGGLFLVDPVWAQSGDKLLLYAFGYLPSDAFSDAPTDSKANRIAVFDPHRSDVQFITLGDDTDTSLRAFQSAQSPRSIIFISPNALSSIDVGGSQPRVIVGRTALDLRGNDDDRTFRLSTQNKLLYLSSPAGDRGAVSLVFDYGEMRIGEMKPLPKLDDLRSDVKAHDGALGYYDADKNAKEWRFHSPIGEEIPLFFGKPLGTRLDPNEVSYSGAKLTDPNVIVWGTGRALHIIDSDAKIVCTRPIGSPAFRMNITPDARMVVVGHGDGTIRWYRLGDPKGACLSLVASLYLTRNEDNTWGFLAWLPNGKFMTAGGAALKDLACYPVGGPDSLGRCTPFQDTEGYFSPDEVKRALAEAVRREPTQNLADVVAAKAEENPASIHLTPATYVPDSPKLSMTVTVAGLGDGPRYLTMSSSGTDVPFTVDGTSYSRDRAYWIDQRPTIDLVVDLPLNVQHYDGHFTICAAVNSSPGAVSDEKSRLRLTQPCKELIWTGGSGPETKKKLWALVIGFSEPPRDGAPQLQFAHEDAINFARFLQRDYKGELPGKSQFQDIDVTLVVAAPNVGWTAMNHDPRIETIRNALTPGKFHLSRIDEGNYVDYIKNTLDDFLNNKIPRQPVGSNINNKILVYFAGHGFTNYIPDRNGPYLKLGLVTPDYNAQTKSGVLWLEQDLANHLRTSDLVSMIIIDACSARNDPGMDNDGISQKEQLNLFSRPPIDDQSQLQLFLGTEQGSVSYEEQGYSVDDFFQDSLLWPQKDLRAKGSGVFSLSLLASLLCREGADGDRFTFASSEDFMSVHFFSQNNKTWDQIIRPQLEHIMHGEFVKPHPNAFGYPGGRLESPILRSGAGAVPKCGL